MSMSAITRKRTRAVRQIDFGAKPETDISNNERLLNAIAEEVVEDYGIHFDPAAIEAIVRAYLKVKDN